MKIYKTNSLRVLSYVIAGFIASTTIAQALPINATITGGTPILSDLNRTVADNDTSVSISASKSQSTTATISKFDASQGVLVGVTATLTPGNTSTYLRADGANAGRGSASVDASWTGSGGLNASGNLNSINKVGSTDGIDNSWNPLTQTITNGTNLDSWVGAGSITSTINTTITANRIGGSGNLSAGVSSLGTNNTGGSTATPQQTDLSASYSVVYNYLEHAIASFDSSSAVTSLDIDFGTLVLGSSISSIGFDIFNLVGINGVALDLTNITSSGDIAAFVTDLGLFSDLAHGAQNSYSASFDPSSVGSFDATYLLTLSDDAVGASTSRHTYSLELHLTGIAINPTVIPEPSMITLLGIGLLGLFGFSKRVNQR